jgi:hypothetical protein
MMFGKDTPREHERIGSHVNNEGKDTLKEHGSIGSHVNNEGKDKAREHASIGSQANNGWKGRPPPREHEKISQSVAWSSAFN